MSESIELWCKSNDLEVAVLRVGMTQISARLFTVLMTNLSSVRILFFHLIYSIKTVVGEIAGKE